MKTYLFSKEESSAIQRLILDDALGVATVTFQRVGSQDYQYRCSDMAAFEKLVESTLQRHESVGKLFNQAKRDGTLEELA